VAESGITDPVKVGRERAGKKSGGECYLHGSFLGDMLPGYVVWICQDMICCPPVNDPPRPKGVIGEERRLKTTAPRLTVPRLRDGSCRDPLADMDMAPDRQGCE